MNALSEIGEILTAIKIPWQTGAYTEPAPDQYIVLVPLSDTFDIMADNRPQFDVQSVRLSVFSKGNYNLIKNQLVRILLDADFFLSDRRYLDYDNETGYHQYVLDVEKHYEME